VAGTGRRNAAIPLGRQGPGCRERIIDGEIIVLNDAGLSHVAALQRGGPSWRRNPVHGKYLFDAGLWLESFQNWQSEFMSTAVLVVLSIFLRRGASPESKPAGHRMTAGRKGGKS
jgi:hypothetical protein